MTWASYITTRHFHFSSSQIKLKIKKLKTDYKRTAQQLQGTGRGRELGSLGPFWPQLSRIWGQTHAVALPPTIGVDVDGSARLLQGAQTADSPPPSPRSAPLPQPGPSGVAPTQEGQRHRRTSPPSPASPQPGPSGVALTQRPQRRRRTSPPSSRVIAEPLCDSELEVFGTYIQYERGSVCDVSVFPFISIEYVVQHSRAMYQPSCS